MSFSKDAKTGVYRACNQAFAEYADDGSVAPVFERADQNMYENKSLLKDRIEVKDKE